jgi:alanine or glycine:cation symporter, AGCS family
MTYAVVAGIAALTTTPFTQTNSIALVFDTQVGVPRWMSGLAIAVLTWLVIIGGIKSIGRTMEKLAPLKVILYLAGSLVVIVTFAGGDPRGPRDGVPLRVHHPRALRVRVFTAIRFGLARGLYANEAGYGTAAVAYGTARAIGPRCRGSTP